MPQEHVVAVLAFQHNMADKNQQVIDKTIDQEYKYGFTTDVDQTKFEPGLDEEVIAKDEVDNIEFELEALNLVRTLDIEHLEAIMRTELGSTVATLSSKELKRDAYNFAKSDPQLFIELSKDEDIKLRNLANRAVEVGILQLTDDNTVFKFANGKKVMTIPFDQHPYAALAQYFKTDEGVDLMKSITKKLS